jgi:subtilase family serine protease
MRLSKRLYPWPSAVILLMGASFAQAQVANDGDDGPPIFFNPPIRILRQASTPTGTTPAQMVVAYGFSQLPNQGAGQTIALIDAYDDPNIESDLGVFDTEFGLPACTTDNGCFTKVYASGKQPTGNPSWGVEISLDVEWAHAIAPQAKIVLVEASNAFNFALYNAVDAGVSSGASVVSMSWGGGESSSETRHDRHFNVPYVTFLASSGDDGYGVNYPAASPYVVGVGGTTLTIQSNGTYVSETAWSGSGGGISAYEPQPQYQAGVVNSTFRAVPDVAYDADPNTGVPVYDSYGYGGWVQVGGTSMAAPEWGALFAIVNSMRAAESKAPINGALPYLYALTADLHDVITGSNGSCGQLCTAGPGYDEVTGNGTPMANVLVPALVAEP